MNLFRLAGDMSHLLSFVILLYILLKRKDCKGISLKTQDLYLLVFLTRYVDLFTNFFSLYNTLFKIFYIGCSAAICFMMRFKEPWASKYQRETKPQDTFQVPVLIVPCAILACIFNYEFSVMEVMWQFSIYLEAVAIMPQLFLLHKQMCIENFTSHYVFFLGSYRLLYIFNWIYRYFTEFYYRQWLVWISGVVQTALYADFFVHYAKAKKESFAKPILLTQDPASSN